MYENTVQVEWKDIIQWIITPESRKKYTTVKTTNV